MRSDRVNEICIFQKKAAANDAKFATTCIFTIKKIFVGIRCPKLNHRKTAKIWRRQQPFNTINEILLHNME